MTKRLRIAALVASVPMLAPAADPPAGIVGNDEWLFYRNELADASAAVEARTSLQLVARFSRVLAANNIATVVTLVPLKMRTYASHLPMDLKPTQYLAGQYQQFAKSLRDAKVPFVDLDTAFSASPKRDSDTPLFMRLDTHWSPTGALVAAEAIKAGIDADPDLARALAAVPSAKYTLTWEVAKRRTPAKDLVAQLPKSAPAFEPESVLGFTVKRQAAAAGLLDDSAGPAITLVGSSYSADWTQFPGALRHTLQRDVLAIAVPANQGLWVGMETYLRDDAFQTRPPKMIVWEMPERDMRAPPLFKYREARYSMDNTEWLLRAAAWVTMKCEPGRAAVKSVTGKLATAAPSKEGDFVDITFSQPLDKLEYVSARLTTYGSVKMKLEASGPGATARGFELAVAGDDIAHNFKAPLFATGKGYDKVRIVPGATHRFSVEDVKVCRQMPGLLD